MRDVRRSEIRFLCLTLSTLLAFSLLLPPSVAAAGAGDEGDDGTEAVDAVAGSEGTLRPLVTPATLGAAAQGDRDWWFDVRGGYYFDVEEPFLGLGGLFALTDLSRNFYFNPNVEFVFVDNANLITFNADFHYDLPVEGAALVWVGAGLAAVRFDPDGPGDSDTDLGGNFFAGFGYSQGTWIPFLQGKLLASEDDTEFVLQLGVRF